MRVGRIDGGTFLVRGAIERLARVFFGVFFQVRVACVFRTRPFQGRSDTNSEARSAHGTRDRRAPVDSAARRLGARTRRRTRRASRNRDVAAGARREESFFFRRKARRRKARRKRADERRSFGTRLESLETRFGSNERTNRTSPSRETLSRKQKSVFENWERRCAALEAERAPARAEVAARDAAVAALTRRLAEAEARDPDPDPDPAERGTVTETTRVTNERFVFDTSVDASEASPSSPFARSPSDLSSPKPGNSFRSRRDGFFHRLRRRGRPSGGARGRPSLPSLPSLRNPTNTAVVESRRWWRTAPRARSSGSSRVAAARVGRRPRVGARRGHRGGRGRPRRGRARPAARPSPRRGRWASPPASRWAARCRRTRMAGTSPGTSPGTDPPSRGRRRRRGAPGMSSGRRRAVKTPLKRRRRHARRRRRRMRTCLTCLMKPCLSRLTRAPACAAARLRHEAFASELTEALNAARRGNETLEAARVAESRARRLSRSSPTPTRRARRTSSGWTSTGTDASRR